MKKPVTHYYTDRLHRAIYATDASVYRETPYAVAYPENERDIKNLITYARNQGLTLTPRGAGTSLAGQCVTGGIVVDISRYMNRILEFDKTRKTVTVQPGVIRDTLNDYLRPHGLFFAPDTSTTNRCTIGGMAGNNSAGTTSIKYGVTRDKVLKIKGVLSDGTTAVFEKMSITQWKEKTKLPGLEGEIYRGLDKLLSNARYRQLIKNNYPPPSLHRRNMGYALDSLLDASIFGGKNDEINPAKLLAGSEGTLMFITEITLQLDALPPPEKSVVAVHFHSLQEALSAVPVSMRHDLYMCELMDDRVLQQTKNNKKQAENRFFIQGDPAAVLLLEKAGYDPSVVHAGIEHLINDLRGHNLGYAFPVLTGDDIKKAIELRAAGLGLLGNIVGDKKSVACIEDTAVPVEKLPGYIAEFQEKMKDFGQKFIYYAHAGAGELHLRPVLNLKKKKDVKLFHDITQSVAHLVKKYKGSLSGEHGDGRVRAEFLPFMLGEETYELLKVVKNLFDPENIFNKGKIISPEPMTSHLRYEPGRKEPEIRTKLNFSDNLGILRMAEKCNGSGDCRRLPSSGGVMCPSYKASLDEKNTTRARANALREFITRPKSANVFDSDELYDVFDLCLSCKACASECPSNVDVAALKAEFLYQYQQIHGVPFRSKMIARSAGLNKYGSVFPAFANFIQNTGLFKRLLGIARERKLPDIQKTSFSKWLRKRKIEKKLPLKGRVYLFVDEFTEYYDVENGKDTVHLLEALGYEVLTLPHKESGRAYISKGMLDEAGRIANENIEIFYPVIGEDSPLVGIEPSAILVFKDEYLRLANDPGKARQVAQHVYTLESFIAREYRAGKITASDFGNEKKEIRIHGHCHQKAVEGMGDVITALSIPEHYSVRLLDTGCCGMAGAFGYEKEHYEFSMKVGETSVFPAVRELKNSEILAVSGTSCRHQIAHGTGVKGIPTARILLKNISRS